MKSSQMPLSRLYQAAGPFGSSGSRPDLSTEFDHQRTKELGKVAGRASKARSPHLEEHHTFPLLPRQLWVQGEKSL